jgi:hypothetical protein
MGLHPAWIVESCPQYQLLLESADCFCTRLGIDLPACCKRASRRTYILFSERERRFGQTLHGIRSLEWILSMLYSTMGPARSCACIVSAPTRVPLNLHTLERYQVVRVKSIRVVYLPLARERHMYGIPCAYAGRSQDDVPTH